MSASVSARQPAVTSHLIDQDIQKARAHPSVRAIVIPPCPESLVRLQEIIAAPELDSAAMDQLASSDVAMAAALIRTANSPLYALAQPVQTVGMALMVLGLQPSVELLSAFITRNALHVRTPLLEHFWESSQRKAIACEHIGRQLYSFDPGLGYSFGLFCHVGIAVMAQSIKGYTGTLVEALARIDRPFVATENANHKTDHAVVGALVARTFCLHPLVVSAIRLHHDLSSLGDSAIDSDVHTLLAAGLVAEQLMRRHEGMEPDVDWETFSEAAMKWLEMSQDDLNLWQDELNEILNAV